MATIKPTSTPASLPLQPQSGAKPAAQPARAGTATGASRTAHRDAQEPTAGASARASKTLTGGYQPLPDSALVHDTDGDSSDLIKTMTAQEANTPPKGRSVGGAASGVSDAGADAVADAAVAVANTAVTSVDAGALPDYTALSALYANLQKQAYTSQDVTEATQTKFADALNAYITAHVDPAQLAAVQAQAKPLLDAMLASVTLQQKDGTLSNDTWDQTRVKMEALLTQVAAAGAPPVYSPVANSGAGTSGTPAANTPAADTLDPKTAGTDPTTTPAKGSITPANAAATGSLTDAQKKFLGDSGVVLNTTTLPGVTSGQVSSFKLYPNGAPDVTDVNQQNNEDCYYLAALGSMAASKSGQQMLQKAIAGPDSKGDYTVSMFDPDQQPVAIKVNPNNMPILTDGSRKAAYNQGSDAQESANWANVMEAAYAKYNDVYKVNQQPGNDQLSGYDAMQQDAIADTSFMLALTGQPASAVQTRGRTGTEIAAAISTGLSIGTPITVYNTDLKNNTDANGNTFAAAHAYAVTNISADGKQVTVRNPWGTNDKNSRTDGAITMSMDDFLKEFEQINL